MKTLLPILLLLGGCAMTPAGTSPDHPARLGQLVQVGGPVVRPLAVVEDSRCPAGVTCVWAGRLVLNVEVTTGKGKEEVYLQLGQPEKVADGMLTLTQVTPAYRRDQSFDPKAYRFVFTFAGGL